MSNPYIHLEFDAETESVKLESKGGPVYIVAMLLAALEDQIINSDTCSEELKQLTRDYLERVAPGGGDIDGTD